MWYEGMGYPPVLQGLWRVALGVLGAFLAVLCLAGLLATSAWSRMHAGPGVMDGGRRMASPVLPLDGAGAFTAPAAAYSLRKLKSIYTGPGIRLRRASDNLETDINFLGFTGFTGAPLDVAAANAHCAATSCFARTWYDQSGNAMNLGEPVAANQPQFIFSCSGTLPCLRTTATQVLQTASMTPVSPMSFGAVANRSAGTGGCNWPQQYPGNSLAAYNGVANQWLIFAGTGIAGAAADGVWHSGIGVFNGASSVLRIDGVEVTGTATVSTTAGALVGLWGSVATTCNLSEMMVWNGYALTAGERAALVSNQRGFWGF